MNKSLQQKWKVWWMMPMELGLQVPLDKQSPSLSSFSKKFLEFFSCYKWTLLQNPPISCFSGLKKERDLYPKFFPITPRDYTPLSMLEVIYKIPLGVLAKKLALTLLQTMGDHQHGFMAGRDIQEPSLLPQRPHTRCTAHSTPTSIRPCGPCSNICVVKWCRHPHHLLL